MKKIILVMILGVLLITGCGGEDSTSTSGVKVEEYKNRINEALKQMGNEITLKILSTEVNEDGRTVITLSENIMIFLDLNKDETIKKVSLGMVPNAYFTEMDNFKFAFLLLVGTVDDTLSFGERNKVIQDLGLSDETVFAKEHLKTVIVNDIMYTYKGSIKENFILQAEYK
jgi:hypothetical protein